MYISIIDLLCLPRPSRRDHICSLCKLLNTFYHFTQVGVASEWVHIRLQNNFFLVFSFLLKSVTDCYKWWSICHWWDYVASTLEAVPFGRTIILIKIEDFTVTTNWWKKVLHSWRIHWNAWKKLRQWWSKGWCTCKRHSNTQLSMRLRWVRGFKWMNELVLIGSGVSLKSYLINRLLSNGFGFWSVQIKSSSWNY